MKKLKKISQKRKTFCMKKRNIIKNSTISISILLLISAIWLCYKIFSTKTNNNLFTTQKPEKRDIQKVMHAEGSLEAYKTSKLGSLIVGRVKYIHVKEGQIVTQNTLLAELENDHGGDTNVRQTKAQLDQAQATLTVLSANYKREKSLYDASALSKEAFEKIVAEMRRAQAEAAGKQALYDKELFLFEQTNIRAPHDGTVVLINIEIGETVSPHVSPPKELFHIAQDLKKMKATLHIDENKIGDVKVGLQAEITVDTYPYRQPWTGPIETMSLGKITLTNASNQQTKTYKAEVLIDNTEGLLRPGMTVHAKAILDQATQVLSVPGFVFQLNSKVLEAAAKVMHYDFRPLDPAKKKELLKQTGPHPIKTLWVAEPKTLIEKAVEIGVTDNAYFHIISGLEEHDNIIADDMTASEELQRLAKQIAG